MNNVFFEVHLDDGNEPIIVNVRAIVEVLVDYNRDGRASLILTSSPLGSTIPLRESYEDFRRMLGLIL